MSLMASSHSVARQAVAVSALLLLSQMPASAQECRAGTNGTKVTLPYAGCPSGVARFLCSSGRAVFQRCEPPVASQRTNGAVPATTGSGKDKTKQDKRN
ncbi:MULTISPECIES: hypothetical protein [Rhizobiaceae]|uniref:hypothetical protein n=1 Tax=Rhizobiaceae TaxID=82115 RepID=UPI00083DAD60|nr:hypothetical protein [Sinorhizobium sp. RAC02]AOF89964.1 hypothetical protein BSY16_1404 [Sinorhizobium sp. RAC02]